MAYVAISGEFIDRVKRKVYSMHQAELGILGGFDQKVSPDSSLYLETVWGEHLNLRSSLPDRWKRHTDCLNIRFKMEDGKVVNHSFSLTGDGETPPYFDNYTHKPVDMNHPEMREAVAYYRRKLEIDNRWMSVSDKVISYLHSCKSLNEAVKLWPDVVMYIDKQDLDRMGVKRERAKESAALEALKSLDTDELVGAAVIARMSGAQV